MQLNFNLASVCRGLQLIVPAPCISLCLRGTSPYDSRNRQRVIDYDVPIELDGIIIHPNDLIAADDDGIVIVPKSVEDQVVRAAWEKATVENHVRTASSRGM